MSDNLTLEWWRKPILEFGIRFDMPQTSYMKQWLFHPEWHYINHQYRWSVGFAIRVLGIDLGAAIGWLKI